MVLARRSKGVWRSTLAFAGIAIIAIGGLIFWVLQPEQPRLSGNDQYQEEDARYYPGGSDCYPSNIMRLPGPERMVRTDACNTAREQHRLQANELIQQRRSADAADAVAILSYQQTLVAVWGVVLGFLTLCAAIAAAIYAGVAAHAAKDAVRYGRSAAKGTTVAAKATKVAAEAVRAANELQRTIFIDSNRARLSIESIAVKSPLEWDREKRIGRIDFDVAITNRGKSGAKQCFVSIDIEVDFLKDPREQFKQRLGDIGRRQFGYYIEAEGTRFVQRFSVIISDDKIQGYLQDNAITFGREVRNPWDSEVPLPLRLIVIVTYRLSLDESLHYTGCVRDFLKNAPDGTFAFGPHWGNTPAEQILLLRNTILDTAAD